MSLTVLVATHKRYWLPKQGPYKPIIVGACKNQIFSDQALRDDCGDNISAKNPNYCELTAIYWAWKNLPQETDVGLVHYRRYFGHPSFLGQNPQKRIFNLEAYEKLLTKAPVIVPPKRNYVIETVHSQYIHAHHKEDLAQLKSIIESDYSGYLPAYLQVMTGTRTHLYNMFVMKRPVFNNYCQWLFDILFKVEAKLNISGYNQNDRRVFGFLSERLLDVWLETNRIPSVQAPIVYFERTNWVKKGSQFLLRKFGLRTQ